jgi:hypothetical protein
MAETEIIRNFLQQNPNITDQIGDFPIDLEKAQKWEQSVIDKVRYVSKNEFKEMVQELCLQYNKVKGKDDIYILLYTPFFDMTGAANYKSKSNFYTTNIAGQYLMFDYIFDLTDTQTQHMLCEIILNKLAKIDSNNKKIYLYICDDCSYSGMQTHELIKQLGVSKFIFTKNEDDPNENINPNIYIRLIIPFILSKLDNYLKLSQITDNIKIRFNKDKFIPLYNATNMKVLSVKYSNKIAKEWTDENFDNLLNSIDGGITLEDNIWIKNIATYYRNELYNILMIDIEPIKDILIRNKKSVGNIVGNNSSWLIYFDHKLADGHSVDLAILSRIIKNCKSGDHFCPDREYKKIKYTYDGKPFIFNQDLSFSKNIMYMISNMDNILICCNDITQEMKSIGKGMYGETLYIPSMDCVIKKKIDSTLVYQHKYNVDDTIPDIPKLNPKIVKNFKLIKGYAYFPNITENGKMFETYLFEYIEDANPLQYDSESEKKYLKYDESKALSPSSNTYESKYLKYKTKYLELKKLLAQ